MRIIVDNQSIKNAVKSIAKKWADEIQGNANKYETKGTQIMQNAIRILKVYDSGNLERNSKMTQSKQDDSIIWSFETKGVDYAVDPRNGLGSSQKYGPRKYDIKAVVDTLKYYNFSKVSINFGNPRPSKPKDRIPPLNSI